MSPARSAGDRLRRLTVMLGWLAQQPGGTPVAEVAERFGISTEEVVRDLEKAAMCGAPPFTPDMMIDVFVDDDEVVVFPNQAMARTPRLTASDAVRVLAAGRAMLAVPGAPADGPLASALDKISEHLGDVVIDLETPAHLADLRRAASEHRRVDVEYYSLWRDEVTSRRIDPLLVHATMGRWYVEAHDHLSGEHRRFRVSRIQDLAITEETFEPAPVADLDVGAAFSAADAEPVTLRLPASARWVTETYPMLRVEESDDGTIEVDLLVAGAPWLERLLLRVGPDAAVLAPEEMADVGRDAARRVLARYES